MLHQKSQLVGRSELVTPQISAESSAAETTWAHGLRTLPITQNSHCKQICSQSRPLEHQLLQFFQPLRGRWAAENLKRPELKLPFSVIFIATRTHVTFQIERVVSSYKLLFFRFFRGTLVWVYTVHQHKQSVHDFDIRSRTRGPTRGGRQMHVSLRFHN